MLADVETQIPPHLQDVFVRSKKNISIREQVALGILLSRYGNVFSKDNNDLGKFTLIRHRINTSDTNVVNGVWRLVDDNTTISKRGILAVCCRLPCLTHVIIIIIIVTSFAPISSKIKLSGATKPGD